MARGGFEAEAGQLRGLSTASIDPSESLISHTPTTPGLRPTGDKPQDIGLATSPTDLLSTKDSDRCELMAHRRW